MRLLIDLISFRMDLEDRFPLDLSAEILEAFSRSYDPNLLLPLPVLMSFWLFCLLVALLPSRVVLWVRDFGVFGLEEFLAPPFFLFCALETMLSLEISVPLLRFEPYL